MLVISSRMNKRLCIRSIHTRLINRRLQCLDFHLVIYTFRRRYHHPNLGSILDSINDMQALSWRFWSRVAKHLAGVRQGGCWSRVRACVPGD